MPCARILVVDDKENMLKLFARILGDEYEVTTASDGGHALALIGQERFDVIVTDLRMPSADGFEVLGAVKARAPETAVIMMTGHGSIEDAVDAMKKGAYDYLQKPFDPDSALLSIARALEHKRLRELAATLQREVEGVYSFHNIVGKSAPMRELYHPLKRAIAVTPHEFVREADLPPEVRSGQAGPLPGQVLARMPYRDAVELARELMSRDYLTALLREFNGNITHAAARAGLVRESLYRLVRRYGIRRDDFRKGEEGR